MKNKKVKLVSVQYVCSAPGSPVEAAGPSKAFKVGKNGHFKGSVRTSFPAASTATVSGKVRARKITGKVRLKGCPGSTKALIFKYTAKRP